MCYKSYLHREVWLAKLMCLHVWIQFYGALRVHCAYYGLRHHHMDLSELSEPRSWYNNTIYFLSVDVGILMTDSLA